MVVSLAVLVLIIMLGAMVVVFSRRARSLEGEQKRLSGPGGTAGLLEGPRDNVTVQNLRIGDIVSYLGQDFLVEGHLEYDEDGWTWDTYMLVDGDVVRWLTVEWDDELEVSLWDEVDLKVSADPGDTLEWQGDTYTLDEEGSAGVTQTGSTGRRRGVRVVFYEYEGPNDRYLTVEKWGKDIEVSVGTFINAYALEIYPGDGSSFD